MKLSMYTVFDSAVQAYLQPFYMQSNGAAIRSFGDTANNPDHTFNKHPGDYTLFHIGEFDDSTCEITRTEAPIRLGCAQEYIQQQDLPLELVQ